MNLWRLTFVTSMWAIWHVRNRMVFEDRKPCHHGTIIIILGLVREAQSFSLGYTQTMDDIITCRKLRIKANPRPPKVTTTIRWRPPPPSFYKVNTDGSIDSDPMFAGCIIRNSMDRFNAAFSLALDRGITMEAEVLAGLHGVVFAHLNGWNSIWLEKDSEYAVRILKSDGKSLPWRLRSCWQKYERIRPSLTLHISHIHREGNSIADRLAKLHTDRVWIGGCPDFLHQSLFHDMNKDYFCHA